MQENKGYTTRRVLAVPSATSAVSTAGPRGVSVQFDKMRLQAPEPYWQRTMAPNACSLS